MNMNRTVELGTLISPAKTVRCGKGNYPVLSMTMHNGLVFQDEKFKKVIASKDTSDYKVVYRNQLVISFPIDEGVLAAQRITDAGIVSPAYGIWDIDQSQIVPEFLEYALRSNRAIQYYKAKLRGSTARRRSLPTPNLLAFTVPLFNIDVQHKILDKIHRVQAIIDKHETQLQKLDDLIKARFVEMFGDIDEYCNVGYYIKALVAGKSLAGEEECENKVLKTGAASFDYFDATQIKNLPLDYIPQHEHLVNVGDIIISRMNTAELTGAAAYVWDVPENIYLPDRLWKAVLQDDCNPIFVWQMLIQPSTKEQIRCECSGTSGSMKNISKPGMLAIKVKKVPVAMQNQFAAFVTQVDKSKVA